MHDIFYFTDVHGQLNLFQMMRDWCYKQDPECTIIYGGDACDRGEFGYDIMQMILDDPQIIYIRGNHEDMFINAANEILKYNPNAANKALTFDEANELIASCGIMHSTGLSIYNGGYDTILNWLLNGTSTEFIKNLDEETVLTFDLGNGVCFSHAGGTYESWTRVNAAEYNEHTDIKPTDDDIEMVIWDRSYLGDHWPRNKTIVFGHTPTYHIPDFVYNLPTTSNTETSMHPVAYIPDKNQSTGWHIAMDTGMTFTGYGYILNCLTMNITGFYDPNVACHTHNQPLQSEIENYKII